MKMFESFFSAAHGGTPCKREAYVWIHSEMRLDVLAARFSQVMELKFQHSDHFDELEAYVASLDFHDITLLRSPLDEGADRFEIWIEPGHWCAYTGHSTDLSNEFSTWLNANLSGVGQFEVMK